MQAKIFELIKSASEIVLEKEAEIKMTTVALLAGGHVLIEDMPGVGKTTLVLTLAKLLGLDSKRVQFTVDLLPSDIIGSHIYSQQENAFKFIPGPVFSQLLMADELNRTSPRTQSALLQAMEEGAIAIEGETHKLPNPFFVIATQNPHNQAGTFPLPESQLDRFLISLELNYASTETEILLFQNLDPRHKISSLKPVLTVEAILKLQKEIENVVVSEVVARYIASLLMYSRTQTSLQSTEGMSPLSTRAGMALVKASKAWAYVEGRTHVRVEDIQAVFVAVVAHRLGGSFGIRLGKKWAQEVLQATKIEY